VVFRRQATRIIERLGKTQLPFQCAHGRPSIVPVVDVRSVRDALVRSVEPRAPPRLDKIVRK
jgi:hypothetical protein